MNYEVYTVLSAFAAAYLSLSIVKTFLSRRCLIIVAAYTHFLYDTDGGRSRDKSARYIKDRRAIVYLVGFAGLAVGLIPILMHQRLAFFVPETDEEIVGYLNKLLDEYLEETFPK